MQRGCCWRSISSRLSPSFLRSHWAWPRRRCAWRGRGPGCIWPLLLLHGVDEPGLAHGPRFAARLAADPGRDGATGDGARQTLRDARASDLRPGRGGIRAVHRASPGQPSADAAAPTGRRHSARSWSSRRRCCRKRSSRAGWWRSPASWRLRRSPSPRVCSITAPTCGGKGFITSSPLPPPMTGGCWTPGRLRRWAIGFCSGHERRWRADCRRKTNPCA